MTKICTYYSALLFLALLPPFLAFTYAQGIGVCVYFFYGDGCLACENVKPYVTGLEQKYPQLSVQRFEVYGNRSNINLLNSLFDKYGIPEEQRVIPAVFIGDKCFVDEEQITSGLEGAIQSHLTTGCPCPSLEGDKAFTPISLLVVTWAALVDSINPCAIGVLIFLLSLISASKDKGKLIRVSVAFVASIYLAYFLLGLGILSTIQVTGLSNIFYRIVGILAIIVGVFNVKDFIRYGGLGFVTEIPASLKKPLNSLLSTATSPIGAFTTGFAVCLFELPCTGGPYLYILGLMAEKTTRTTAVPLLLYYNLIFISPLILITLLIFLGASSTKRMTHLRHKFTRILHLTMGLTMITIGVATLLELI